MFERIGYTWQLMGASWQVLKQDKKLMLLPLISGICCLMVMAAFAIPMFLTNHWMPPARNGEAVKQVLYYSILFLFYFCNYLVITFFNSIIVYCAFSRMEGRDASIGQGFSEAASRIHLIVGWALLAATVGLVLRIIEDRSEKVGAFIAGLLGMAFSVISFMVVPVLVIERKGPLAALKQSTRLLKSTWGDQLVGNFSFGTVFGLMSIPAILLIVLGVFMLFSGKLIALAILLIVVGVALMIALSLVQSTLQVIFQTALYLQVRAPEIPHPFPSGLIEGAMTTR